MGSVPSLIALTLVYALGIALHLPALKKAGRARDYIAFFGLLVIAIALSYALVLMPDKVPNPTDLINYLVMGFGRRFFEAP